MQIENPTHDGIKLHLQEADDLKKQWFTYVFESIQKLYDKIEMNATTLRREKDDLLKILMDYRTEVNKDIQVHDLKNKDDLDKLRVNLEIAIDALEKQLNTISVSNSELEHLLDNARNELKIEFMIKLEAAFKVHVTEDELKFKEIAAILKNINDSGIESKTKVGVYVTIITLIVTTLMGGTAVGLVMLFKNALKAFILGV